jgi:hypothetical protein
MTTDISVGVRWDPIAQHEVIEDYEFDYDGGNSSSRLFERSRIKALAGNLFFWLFYYFPTVMKSFSAYTICLQLRLRFTNVK